MEDFGIDGSASTDIVEAAIESASQGVTTFPTGFDNNSVSTTPIGSDPVTLALSGDLSTLPGSLSTLPESLPSGVDVPTFGTQSADDLILPPPLSGNNSNFVATGSGDDKVTGSDSIDIISGGSGNDQLTGGTGDDIMSGGPGNDVIDGGEGGDVLLCGEGQDLVVGGSGGDEFVLPSQGVSDPSLASEILDFDPTEGDMLLLPAGIQPEDLTYELDDQGNTLVRLTDGSILMVLEGVDPSELFDLEGDGGPVRSADEQLDNRPSGAKDLGILSGERLAEGQLTSRDTYDLFKFRVETSTLLDSILTPANGAKVQLALYQDKNRDGVLTADEQLASTADDEGSTAQSMENYLLQPGEYYLSADLTDERAKNTDAPFSSSYKLNLLGSAAVNARDTAGNGFAGAVNLGTFEKKQVNEFLSGEDLADIYRIDVAEGNYLEVGLRGELSNKVTLALVTDNNSTGLVDEGELIEFGRNGFSAIGLAEGTYYLVAIADESASGSYQLDLEMGGGSPVDNELADPLFSKAPVTGQVSRQSPVNPDNSAQRFEEFLLTNVYQGDRAVVTVSSPDGVPTVQLVDASANQVKATGTLIPGTKFVELDFTIPDQRAYRVRILAPATAPKFEFRADLSVPGAPVRDASGDMIASLGNQTVPELIATNNALSGSDILFGDGSNQQVPGPILVGGGGPILFGRPILFGGGDGSDTLVGADGSDTLLAGGSDIQASAPRNRSAQDTPASALDASRRLRNNTSVFLGNSISAQERKPSPSFGEAELFDVAILDYRSALPDRLGLIGPNTTNLGAARISDIKQGGLGDCAFLAGVASLFGRVNPAIRGDSKAKPPAEVSSSSLQSLLKGVSGENYTFAFYPRPGSSAEQVTVDSAVLTKRQEFKLFNSQTGEKVKLTDGTQLNYIPADPSANGLDSLSVTLPNNQGTLKFFNTNTSEVLSQFKKLNLTKIEGFNAEAESEKTPYAANFAATGGSARSWVNALERGYAAWRENSLGVPGYTAIGNGDLSSNVLQRLTGLGTQNYSTAAEIFEEANKALDHGDFVVTGGKAKIADAVGIVGGHAYALTDAYTLNGEKRIVVYNPHGVDSITAEKAQGQPFYTPSAPYNDGFLDLSLDEFTKYFGSIAVTVSDQPKPPTTPTTPVTPTVPTTPTTPIPPTVPTTPTTPIPPIVPTTPTTPATPTVPTTPTTPTPPTRIVPPPSTLQPQPNGGMTSATPSEFFTLFSQTDRFSIPAIGTASLGKIRALDGNDTIEGSAGDDEIFGNQGADVVKGRAGNDSLSGGQGEDRFYGNDGNDFLKGEQGNDLLVGGEGNDTLGGGLGNDVLVGGKGTNYLTGGRGADVFVLLSSSAVQDVNAADRIIDFVAAEGDRIALTDGLTVDNLVLESAGKATVIRLKSNNAILGVVENATPADLRDRFTTYGAALKAL